MKYFYELPIGSTFRIPGKIDLWKKNGETTARRYPYGSVDVEFEKVCIVVAAQ